MAKPGRKGARDGEPLDELLERFGENIRDARINAGLTQVELASQSGLSQQYVSLIERGRQNVTLTTARILSGIVGRDLLEMLRRRS
jgi:transcriptional regulator with XRE-family HTH domain